MQEEDEDDDDDFEMAPSLKEEIAYMRKLHGTGVITER